jgi:predicted DsbA family dithiol-disulfide isomerase
VPFFVVDRSLAASGAQSPDILAELLSRGWSAPAAAPEQADTPAAAQS